MAKKTKSTPAPPSLADIREAISSEAKKLGFDAVGFMQPQDLGDAGKKLEKAIEAGWHADMHWMAERLHHRRAPENLWPDVKTIIALAMNYSPQQDPRFLLSHKSHAQISVYAKGQDYHDTIKKRLKALGRFMAETYRCQLKVFVDTAPVMEKPIAAAAGLGWQGKHSNLVSRDFGSWLFLGAVYTDMDLLADRPQPEDPIHRAFPKNMAPNNTAPSNITPNNLAPSNIAPPKGSAGGSAGRYSNSPHKNQCGRCDACLTACPTKAFVAPYQLDARRCISYLTIEHHGPIPLEFRAMMGNRIYGCDDCLAACPWNKFAKTAQEAAFFARVELQAPRLHDLLLLEDAGFRQFFSASPIKRIGRNRFIRNCLIAAGNSGDQSLSGPTRALLSDPDPTIQEAASWAIARLNPPS